MLKIIAIEDDEKVQKNIQELVRKLSIQLDKELSIVFYPTYNNKLENEKFVIMPVYKNKNFINIDFTGIFEIKMISIINIFLNIRKMKINNCKKNKKFNKNFNKNNERRLNKKNFEYCN